MVETGWFYGGLIDPILVPMRKKINEQIKSGESLIDVACGTGAQVFESAAKVSEAIGIDLSPSMINKALRSKKRKDIKNVSFFVSDATNLSHFSNSQFEVATMSLALHQFDPGLYTPILSEMKRVAKKIIILDYAVPLPQNYSGIGSRVAEFFAGIEHHKNFRKFCKIGGLNKVLPENHLEIIESELFAGGAFQMVVCTPSNGINHL